MPDKPTRSPKPAGPTGFTLIELLVVISIIALLVGILLPALGAARQSAITSKCLAQMRQIALGAQFYSNDWNERLPLIPNFDRQGQQIEMLDPYLGGNKEIFICPNAENTQTSGELWNQARPLNVLGNGVYESHISGLQATQFQPAWPNGESFFTDYKLNDNIGVIVDPQNRLNDANGIIDRRISTLPATTWVVVAIDLDWPQVIDGQAYIPPPGVKQVERHGDGGNLSFLDGHSEHMSVDEYRAPGNPSAKKDPYGNDVWYKWGNPNKGGTTFTPGF